MREVFTLTSTVFRDGEPIPVEFTCDGAGLAPALRWDHPPEGTRGFALTLVDPDALGGEFTHWVLYDLPFDHRELPNGGPSSRAGEHGANDFGHAGYGGPCPPPGDGPHRYRFTLYALDLPETGLGPGAQRSVLLTRIQGHVLAEAALTGSYERR